MPLVPTDSATDVNLAEAIAEAKRKHNAVILAHYYQEAAVQEVADFVGDSLDLARRAASVDADQIVFCGVHFMAETAKILNPDKPVLLPDLAAGCSLAESAPAEPFREFVEAHPDHVVVTYVNSTAAVKALSDYCVTSTNAVDVIRSIPEDKPIIFAPDQYLGDWVSRETGRELLCWQGSCEVHELFSESAIRELMDEHPDAGVLVHPECLPQSVPWQPMLAVPAACWLPLPMALLMPSGSLSLSLVLFTKWPKPSQGQLSLMHQRRLLDRKMDPAPAAIPVLTCA